MFAAGAEYFAPPEEYDRDTLRRLSVLCIKLRSISGLKKTPIEDAKDHAVAVRHVDLAAAAIKRHIKLAKGTRQLALWYVLDALVFDKTSPFRLAFQEDLADLALEAMPWDDKALVPQVQALVNTFTSKFSAPVLGMLDKARKDKLWRAANKAQWDMQKEEEERQWEREEKEHQDAEGLDEYAQPCMRYLQGKCELGDRCAFLHPPGKEGTLPPEARPGDWRCDQCGSVNRHWRRRCFHCPSEKPQYKKEMPDVLRLVRENDPKFDVFSAQFNYDPMDVQAAVQHWSPYFQGVASLQWRQDRSAAYRVRILRRAPRNE